MSELWAKWEGEVIEGGLPLRRLVGVSDHSGVFLTEAPAYDLRNAAIKLVPAIPTLAESQLAHWNAAASLSHPRLLRLYAAGRCQLPGGPMGQGNLHFLYVLMEYADQTLAQLLETRALTEMEARETLPPTLDGLGFLHAKNLVQGQLKPSNILVVGEQLKLASDTIRPAGEAATSISMSSVYDPPEGRDGSFSTAGDIWALGVTLYEALTRTTPTRPDERGHGVVLPPDFPPASADVIRECLSRRPIDRPSVTALQAWVSGKVRYPGAPSSSTAAAGSTAAAASTVRVAGAAGTNRSGTMGNDPGELVSAEVPGVNRARPAGADGVHHAGELVGIGVTAAGSEAMGSDRGRVRADADAAGFERGARPAGLGAADGGGRAVTGVAGAAAGTGLVEARNASAPNARTAEMDRSVPAGTSSSASGASGAASSGAVAAASGSVPGRLTIRAVVERGPIEEEAPAPPRSYLPWAVAAVAIIGVGWGAVHLLGRHSGANPPATNASADTAPSSEPLAKSAPSLQESPPAPAAPPQRAAAPPSSEQHSHHRSAGAPTPQGSATSANASAAVVHEEIPNVPHSALATIHGHVKVAVRVTVDSSGNVVGDTLDHPGPSHYFARVASQAARKWKFAPTGDKSSRQWLVHFDFSRGGTTAHATGVRS